MKRRHAKLVPLVPLLTLAAACAPEPAPELRFVARGGEPAWTLHVWADSISLDMEGDHGTHAFPTPIPSTAEGDGVVYEVTAGEGTFRLEIEPDACQGSELPARATLVLGSGSYEGCGREPRLAIARYRDPAGAFELAAPGGWETIDETRSDTTALTWRAPAEPTAELTLIAYEVDGTYETERLAGLAEAFVRARFPTLRPDADRTVARSPDAVRLRFSSPDDPGGPRVRIDVEQRAGELRLLALYAADPEAAVLGEASVLLGSFRWLLPPPVRLPPGVAPVAS